MELKLGNIYKTRQGGVIKITNIDYSYTSPFFGIIKSSKGDVIRPCSYNSSGMVYSYKQSDFDIIRDISLHSFNI